MVERFESRMEVMATPRLRWAWLAATVITALVTIGLMVSLVLPPYGNTTLKAVLILLFGLASIACILFTIFGLIEGDAHPELT